MSYILSVFGGSATVEEHRITAVALGDGALVTLEVVDTDENVLVAFTHAVPSFSFDDSATYMLEVGDRYAEWQEAVGATKTIIPDAES